MIKVAKLCLFALAFIPFMVAHGTFFPYATGESIYARGLLGIVSVLFTVSLFTASKFRTEMVTKAKVILKNRMFVAVSAFVLVSVISTIFAVNKFNAFWGTIERAEGLIGLIYFFSVFVFTLLIFEKRDWITFFKLNLLVSFVVASKELVQFVNGVDRPSSFLDNPTFLAGYFLFSVFCVFIAFSESKSKLWKYFSITTGALSILGIFFTQTRSTILGLIAGIVVVLVYFITKGKSVNYKRFNLRQVSSIILLILIVVSVVFLSTRKSEIWQKVPGLGRVASISDTDATTQTRLIALKLSLQAVNPVDNGLKKFLIGWGPDNFSLAYGKYFNPKQFDYEMRWFDRSHNKLADILVMTGLIGLLAYLSICFFLFKSLFKKKDITIANMAILFFNVSLLVHLLFVFDQITTSIPFFAILAFAVYLSLFEDVIKEKENKKKHQEDNKLNTYLKVSFLLLSIFLSFVFFRNDLTAYFQMKKYMHFKDTNNSKAMLENIDKVFDPITSSRMNVLKHFLIFTEGANNPEMAQLSDIALVRSEEYVRKNPNDVKFFIDLATAYTKKGKALQNQSLTDKGEEYFKKMLIYTPNRPDSNMGLALNLFYQKKYAESFVYSEKAFDLSNTYFVEQAKTVNEIYPTFFHYFYTTKEKVNFMKTVGRLKDSQYITPQVFNQITSSMEGGVWPYINFTS
jgi:O-antigen ligase